MNYPNAIKKKFKTIKSYGNRGMNLEDDINLTNKYYLDNDIAVIYKKPTPITINKVDYKSRKDAVIKEAHFLIPSTTDYNGIYKGKYIDFEAKETNSLTSFPLGNIHKHQIEHLIRIYNHKGIGFIIVNFNKLNKIYILMIKDLVNFLNNNKRASIPLEYFENKGIIINRGYNPRIDYIKVLEEKGVFYEKEN